MGICKNYKIAMFFGIMFLRMKAVDIYFIFFQQKLLRIKEFSYIFLNRYYS